MLYLRGNRRRPRIMHHGHFLWCGPRVNAATSAVVAHATIATAWHRIVVNVVHHRGIDVRHIAVISESAVIPVRAVIAPACIPKAIVDATIETNVRSPVAGMPPVVAALIIPIRRRPECIHPRRENPRAWNPVIAAARSISPIAGRPVVTVAWNRRLAVFRKRRRRLIGVNWLLVRCDVVRVVRGIVLRVVGQIVRSAAVIGRRRRSIVIGRVVLRGLFGSSRSRREIAGSRTGIGDDRAIGGRLSLHGSLGLVAAGKTGQHCAGDKHASQICDFIHT